MSTGKEEMFLKMDEGKKNGYIHISFSEFSLFKQCGHKHLIQKYLGIDEDPPSIHLYFGNAIHESIEKTFEDNYSTEKRVEYFRTNFRKNMLENMLNTPEIKELDAFVEQGENILRILDVNGILTDYELVSVEEPLYEQVYGKFYFKGFIDLVVRNRKTGRILIIDWKTSSMPWDMFWKNKDLVFLMQMKLYKYFWARKNNIDLTNVDTKYIVLNRLKDKKKPELGFGEIIDVPMSSSMGEIRNALEELAKVLRSIHIENKFPKSKYILDYQNNPTQDMDGNYLTDDKPCKFCKYKGEKHPLCNNFPEQTKTLLLEHGK
jgi:hypothetical protein